MKHIRYIFGLFLFFTATVLPAQTNLVLNPSLEDTICCPRKIDIHCAQHWYQPNILGSSTDYFHPCNITIYNNYVIFLKYVRPRTGYAYALIATANGGVTTFPGYREYLCGKLSKPLIGGKCYNVQFYVVPAFAHNRPVVGMSRIGIGFSNDTIVDSSLTAHPMDIIPYVDYTGGVICDTTGWTRISGSFIASGGERHFVIGNFHNESNTISQTCYNPTIPPPDGSGLLIDDVSVWPCDATVYAADAGRDKQVCYGDEVILGQNLPDDEYRFLWSTTSHRLTPKDLWDTLATTPYLSVKPEQTTTYYLWVRDFKMDVTYDSVTVFVESCITPPEIPNVFTPNGDGINDLFAFKNHELWELETCIRNRWGMVVFEGQNDHWWDGTIHGQPAAEGVYFYVVTARNHFGQHKEFHGVVTLLR